MFDLSQDSITEGSISRALVVLSVPIIGMQIVHVINSIVDTFWLGRVGENAVAAVGLIVPIIALVAAVQVLAAGGTQIVVSQHIGTEDRPAARRVTFNGILLTFALFVVVASFVILNAEDLLRLIGAGPELAGLAALYLATLIAFYPVAAASDTAEYAYTAVGDSRAGLHINVLTAAVNFALDPFLIFGWWVFPELGVQGAAIASGVGMTTGAMLTVVYIAGYRETFQLTRESLSVDLGDVREILDVGAPLGVQRVIGQTVRVMVIGLVTIAGGAPAVAAYTVGARVAGIAIVPCSGMQQAAQSIIGQNLGANQASRAFRTTTVGVALAGGLLTVFGGIQWFFPELIVTGLVPDISGRARELTVFYLRVLAIGYPAMGATYLVFAGFNGASRTRTSMVVDVVKYWGIRLPVALVAIPATVTLGAYGITASPGLDWGVEAVFWAVTVSNILAFVGVGSYFVYTARDGMFDRAADRASDSAGAD
ncbi:MAG: MATE family efflux transporter [Halopenitus sp.]